MQAYERLLNYTGIYTTSDEKSNTVPSTMRQFDLAHLLVSEMSQMGISDVSVNEQGYVYAKLPATEGFEDRPAIGLIAHMDTSPDFCGEGVKPQVISNYDGSDVLLGDSGRVLSVKEFPHLASLKGRTLITSDGTTLLGADDKAGIAEILTAVEIILKDKIPHGKICIGFTPDEEIGRGADAFDVEKFGAEFAYTVDGGAENEIEYENFNAAAAEVRIQGFAVHPGDSKDTMINASLVAMEFNSMLPSADIPRNTEGYEGFFHLTGMKGDVSEAELTYIIRDHDASMFEYRIETMKHAAKTLNEKYGENTIGLSVREQYRNMKSKIEPCMHLIENAKKAEKEAGLEPNTLPIRGGTDGATLSYMGLPCPNLGTGGYAFHGPYEHITAEGMDAVVQTLINILKIYAGVPLSEDSDDSD